MENEIKVNEYIRTKRGIIDKAVKILDDYIFLESKFFITEYGESSTFIKKTDVVKHSPNLKDLIQKDDFVNGDRVVAIDYTEDENGNYVDVLGIMEIDDDYAYPIELRVINIQEVVTKEMMESISYKVTKM